MVPSPGVELISARPPDLGGEAVDLGKAEAGPLADRLGGEKGIEDALEHVGGNAFASVGEADADQIDRVMRDVARGDDVAGRHPAWHRAR